MFNAREEEEVPILSLKKITEVDRLKIIFCCVNFKWDRQIFHESLKIAEVKLEYIMYLP
jgi:hypothetical protein